MSIVSIQFLVFIIILTFIYFIVPKKSQWIVILIADLVFYTFSGIKYIIFILTTAIVTFWAAIKIEAIGSLGTKLATATDSIDLKKEIKCNILSIKKLLCGIAIVISAGIWIVLKYSNFFINNINSVLLSLHLKWEISPVSWVLPLGISFYTFHAIGYLIDVYRGKYKAQKNFGKYFTFMAYFPHIIQGPFSRYDHLGKSILEEHSFSYDRLCRGCARILWGFYKKLVVADKLAIAITAIFANYEAYTGVHILFAVFGYCIRLYADFSGYMDIVCGLSHILGINLAENFRQPYFARSVDEFWRRWHITLGKWFKDYVFYPVSMGKIGQKLGKLARKKWGAKMGKLVPGYFALVFVWTATGLWHGANWTYLVWGYLNLFVIMSAMQLSDFYEKVKHKLHIKSEHWLWQFFCIIRTFCLVCFFRFFSVAPDLHTACSMLKHLFFNLQPESLFYQPLTLFVGMKKNEIFCVSIGTLIILMIDIFNEKGNWESVKSKCPFLIKNAIYIFLLFSIFLFAGSNADLTGGFMYANF